ncbi:MAG TPA: NapC/NirT family cytochrome c [Thermoanaerobaculia bacterium]|nr:NapC/NirT family cytochrome c [Thermoanaerobaculia bacterium]
MEIKKFPRLTYNWISALGAALAIVSGLTLAVLLAFGLFFKHEFNPYFGIFVYTILPPLLVFGLLLIPIGMYREWRRWGKSIGEATPRWPRIDLNKPSHRNAAFVFVLGTILFFIISGVATYGAYQYSDSVAFCGKTCHSVMAPEYTTYQHSPHARVPCASCHVGPGAGWFVKSKLSGTYQIYAVLTNKYPRPIPTPIESLRPAQATCEQCHWPRMIFGAQQKQFNNYKYDKENSYWPINMLLKTGGGAPSTGQTSGIHWHMNIGVKVEYIARDAQRQDIPWVKVTDKTTGRVTIYQDKSNPLTKDQIAAATPRIMDCMDCHNRPSHIFKSPDQAIDHAMLTGDISTSLPFAKKEAVEVMAAKYDSDEQAMQQIANKMTDFYRTKYPQIAEQDRVAIDSAIKATQAAYKENIFPRMKARWSDYPTNIGHFISKGCMRCHDGNHVSADGVVVPKSCTTCHTILSEGSGDNRRVASSPDGLTFQHPEDVGGAWQDTGCFECHSGTQP